jgi:hypothetical protein
LDGSRHKYQIALGSVPWGEIVICPFEPVHIDDSRAGLYLTIEHNGTFAGRVVQPAPDAMVALGHLKSDLLFCIAQRMTSANTVHGVAKALCRTGDLAFGTVKQRWERLRSGCDFGLSQRRKNGIVLRCRRDVAGQSKLVDAMFEAPIWEFVAQLNRNVPAFHPLKARVAALGVSIPRDLTDHHDWFALLFAGRFCRSSAWAAANVMTFWLAYAYVAGDPVQYGLAYRLMLTVAAESSVALHGSVVRTMCRGDVSSPSDLDRQIMKEFWTKFENHIRTWFSRMRVIDASTEEVIALCEQLRAAGVPSTWEIVLPTARSEQGG